MKQNHKEIYLICRLWGRRGRPPWSCLRLSSAAWAKCHSGWAGITHRLRGGCTNYITLHFCRRTHILVLGRTLTLARAKGPMSFSSTREQSRHTCGINYCNEWSIICSSHHCSIPRRYNYRSLINLWRTPLNSLSFPYKRVRERSRRKRNGVLFWCLRRIT